MLLSRYVIITFFEKIVSKLLELYFPKFEVIVISLELLNLISATTFVRYIMFGLEYSISPCKASIIYSFPLASFEE